MRQQHLIILGRPASKKNSKQVNTRTGRIFSSKAFTAFKADASKQLLKYHRYHFTCHLCVQYLFYQKGGYEQDNDNAMGTINDILQDCGFFENDKQIKEWKGKIIPNSSEWKTLITITPIEPIVQGK